jgi:hypothetical protein
LLAQLLTHLAGVVALEQATLLAALAVERYVLISRHAS